MEKNNGKKTDKSKKKGMKKGMKKSEIAVLTAAAFFGGIVLGFMLSPVKHGVYISDVSMGNQNSASFGDRKKSAASELAPTSKQSSQNVNTQMTDISPVN